MTLFARLFQGELLNFAQSSESRRLGQAGRDLVAGSFGPEPDLLTPEEFREALARSRAQLAKPAYRELAFDCLRALGFQWKTIRLDQVRLRAVAPGLEQVEEAAAVFYCHRDTWYGNPACQVNAWLPLQPVDRSNSFVFFLDYFERSIDNDSHLFKADEFGAQGGFGRVSARPADSVYPRALASPTGRQWAVEAEADQLLLFSAAHLHQTLPNRSPRPRFSLDFRFYCALELQSGRGAPDPDNHSVGLLISNYRSRNGL